MNVSLGLTSSPRELRTQALVWYVPEEQVNAKCPLPAVLAVPFRYFAMAQVLQVTARVFRLFVIEWSPCPYQDTALRKTWPEPKPLFRGNRDNLSIGTKDGTAGFSNFTTLALGSNEDARAI